MLTTHTSAKT